MRKGMLVFFVSLFLLLGLTDNTKGELLSFNPASVGRIVWNSNSCTGFIFAVDEVPFRGGTIYRNWVATAGHCAKETPRGATFVARSLRKRVGENNIFYPSRSHSLLLVGFSLEKEVGVYYFLDYIAYPRLSPDTSGELQHNEPVLVIGYGRGVLMMSVARYLKKEGQSLVFQNAIWFGHSGSPVINSNGKVVGIVWGMRVKNPLACFFWGMCQRDENIFYASPISNVWGIIEERR